MSKEHAKELQVYEGSAPVAMMQVLLEKNIEPEKIEKLLAIQERWEANEARKYFAKDFAAAQAEIRPVAEKAKNQQTNSKYALLEDVIGIAQPIYTKYGFSIIFYEGDTPKPDHIRINADVLHSLGHKETYYYDVPSDGLGIKGNVNMTKIHAKASSTSYARRYLMCMIWNIATHDDDGNAGGGDGVVEVITDKQKSTIVDLLNSKGITDVRLLKYLGYESLDQILAKDFNKAVTSIKATPEKKGKE